MKLENISYEELIKVLHDYINENYDYEIGNIYGDEMEFILDNGKVITITIDIDSDEVSQCGN